MTSITISQKEIEEKICKLKVKKATGPDGVSARLLKYAGMTIAPSLTSVFKQSVEAWKLPDQWKIARVSAAFKKGREEDRTCYRPLSMLSIQSKLIESCTQVISLIMWLCKIYLITDNGLIGRESQQNSY